MLQPVVRPHHAATCACCGPRRVLLPCRRPLSGQARSARVTRITATTRARGLCKATPCCMVASHCTGWRKAHDVVGGMTLFPLSVRRLAWRAPRVRRKARVLLTGALMLAVRITGVGAGGRASLTTGLTARPALRPSSRPRSTPPLAPPPPSTQPPGMPPSPQSLPPPRVAAAATGTVYAASAPRPARCRRDGRPSPPLR